MDLELAPDCFFDSEPLVAIVLCELVDGLTSFVTLRYDGGGNPGAHNDRASERNKRVNDDNSRLFGLELPGERVKPGR